MSKEIVSIATHDSINCKLSQDEINERAVQSISVYGELEQTESEFKTFQKEWKKKIENVESRYNTLRRAVETREEFREVDCHREFDLKRGVTWLRFEGKKYLERVCGAEELELARQGNLFDHATGEAPL
jgi:vacuolar-type H+-ATPase subunit I/STV1